MKTNKKAEKVAPIQEVSALEKYSNAPFFKKKDEDAVKFLKEHPIPANFWKS